MNPGRRVDHVRLEQGRGQTSASPGCVGSRATWHVTPSSTPRAALYADWERVAVETVAYPRLDAARHPGDTRTAAMIEELSEGAPAFRRIGEEHQVAEKTHGVKRPRHPEVGSTRPATRHSRRPANRPADRGPHDRAGRGGGRET
ncbi:hypothetical protein [Streptosporangium saharense]|uniref:MmyB family transcriptional regulator n=1 Tax=Streptosporangium saharense TaxID=1706840 RepID=UPI00331BAF1E